MREAMHAAKTGRSGHIRLASIPTALAMIPRLTEPFQAKHPDVTLSVVSRNSLQVLGQLDSFEIDAGITYLDNEPLGRVTSVPLYRSEEHTSELQSLMRISYAVFCSKKKTYAQCT